MAASSKRKLAFLFGSGVSIPAGMPKLDKITEKVLSGEGIFYHNEIFSSQVRPFSDPTGKLEEEQRDYVQIIVKFLHRLRIEIQEYYKKHPFKSGCDYEDLYYIVNQIYDSEVGEFDNPATQPLVDKILPEIKSTLSNSFLTSRWTLSKLAWETIKYIEYVVFHLLDRNLKSLEYLKLLAEAPNDNEFSNVDIFTLNHDTIIEKFLTANNIQFTDGFFKPGKEEHRYWNPTLFNNRSFKVRLFKLHGSINWFRFRREDAVDWSGESIIIPSGMINFLITDSKGRIWRALDKQSVLLIGRYNKMLDYLSGIYTEIHYQFYNSLKNLNQLIICGYGLGDRGINTQIVNWLYSSNNSKIIVVDPRPKELKNKYLSSISNKWDLLQSTDKLRIIEKGIEETSWHEIKSHLLDN